MFKHHRFVWTKFVTHEINNGDDSWTLYTIAYVDKMPAYAEYIMAAFRYNGIESGNKDESSRWINCSEILPWVGLGTPGYLMISYQQLKHPASLNHTYTSQWFTSATRLSDLTFDICRAVFVIHEFWFKMCSSLDVESYLTILLRFLLDGACKISDNLDMLLVL